MVSLGWLRSLADHEEGQHVRLTQTPHTDCVTPRVQRVQRALVNRDRGPRGGRSQGAQEIKSYTTRTESYPAGHSANTEGESWGYTTVWTIWTNRNREVPKTMSYCPYFNMVLLCCCSFLPVEFFQNRAWYIPWFWRIMCWLFHGIFNFFYQNIYFTKCLW